jgi:cytochrome c-type biogenesis protein CcmE
MLHTTIGKVILTVALFLAGGGFLVYASLDDAQYYEMVDKVAADPDKWVGKDLKLHGYVEPGSIREEMVNGKVLRTFVLEMNGRRIEVKFEGVKVDNLKDRAEVVAQGRLFARGSSLEFEASELMAKCPSKYEGAQSNRDLF